MKDSGYTFFVDSDWNLYLEVTKQLKRQNRWRFGFNRISDVLKHLRQRLSIKNYVYSSSIIDETDCLYEFLDFSIFCDELRIVRETEIYLSKYDISKLSKKTLLKANMLFHPLIEGLTFGCLPYDYIRYENENESPNYIYLEDVGIEKFIDLLLPDEIFSMMIDQVIVIEAEDNKIFVVDRVEEDYYENEIMYRTYTYSPKLMNEIFIEISDQKFVSDVLDKNLLKEIITKSIELYEKNIEQILNEIVDYTNYYLNWYKQEFGECMFDAYLWDEDYLSEMLITTPIIMIEDIDDLINNKLFSIRLESAFDTEHGIKINIKDDKII